MYPYLQFKTMTNKKHPKSADPRRAQFEDPDNMKNESCIQGVRRIITKSFQITPYVMTDQTGNFMKTHSCILP